MKRLFFDIEVSPNVGFFWQPGYNITIDYGNIIRERSVICAAYKWEGNDKVYALTWDKDQNDRYLLETLVTVMNEADEIIAHNGDKFDQSWIRTRCIFHGISMAPNFISIDTLKAARNKFRFNSNRLDYIGKFLGVGAKSDTGGFDLWRKVTLENNKKSLREMVEYCKNDVVLLEKVFKKMNPYIPAKSHISGDNTKCPECNSGSFLNNGTRITASGVRYQRLQCKKCGKWTKGKVKDEKNS